MTTQLVLDLGEDLRAPRRPVRPTVPAGAVLRAVAPAGGAKAGSRTSSSAGSSPRSASRTAPRTAGRVGSPALGPRPTPDYFRLDEHTRAIGERGVAEARRILACLAATHAA